MSASIKDVLTTSEAGELLGLKRKTIIQYIDRGLITSLKKGRDHLIEREEIARFARERQTPGGYRPPKKG